MGESKDKLNIEKVVKPKRVKRPMHPRTRREILRGILMGAGVLAVSSLGFVPILKKWVKRLRPPGALAEKEFLAACIKCGQCVQVCPVVAIKLADIDEGFGVGVPYVDAREQACDFACDTPQCVLACPTGALTHSLKAKEDVRMGLAELTSPQTCLGRMGEGFKGQARGSDFKGLHRYMDVDRWNPIPLADYPYELEICDLCVRECPIEGAISMKKMSDDPSDLRLTPVVHEACVGCGMCEMICPVEAPCITIKPYKKWGVA